MGPPCGRPSPGRKSASEVGADTAPLEDPSVVELPGSMFVDSAPAARRLMELLEVRGWSGWTQLAPTPDAREY